MFGVFGWSSPIYDKVSTKRSVYYGAMSTMKCASASLFNLDQTAELLKWYNAGQRGIQFLYFEDALPKECLYKENDIFTKKEKVSRKFGYKLKVQVKSYV